MSSPVFLSGLHPHQPSLHSTHVVLGVWAPLTSCHVPSPQSALAKCRSKAQPLHLLYLSQDALLQIFQQVPALAQCLLPGGTSLAERAPPGFSLTLPCCMDFLNGCVPAISVNCLGSSVCSSLSDGDIPGLGAMRVCTWFQSPNTPLSCSDPQHRRGGKVGEISQSPISFYSETQRFPIPCPSWY